MTDRGEDARVGCLLGVGIGDALGFPVEFMNWGEIESLVGGDGVRAFLPPPTFPPGTVSDDTQMTLFVAEGLLRWHAHARIDPFASVVRSGRAALLRWRQTQRLAMPLAAREPSLGGQVAVHGLLDDRRLMAQRAPGGTCLSALERGFCVPPDPLLTPVNGSFGCGAVMRMAPVGLLPWPDPFAVGCQLGAITHGHPRGYLPAGALALMVNRLVRGQDLRGAVAAGRDAALAAQRGSEVGGLLDRALRAAARGGTWEERRERIAALGGGWVGDECLAIAAYAALAAQDPLDGLALAVSHDGDSDSTGAVAGALLGARHGASGLPPALRAVVELGDLLETMGRRLWSISAGDD